MRNTPFLVAALLVSSTLSARELVLKPGDIRVEDGDTLVVVLDGKEERVQLAGIDAPEDADNPKLKKDLERTGLEQEALLTLGRAATEKLSALVRDSAELRLNLDSENRDRYGRLTATIDTDEGGSLNQAMVADGYAIALPSGDETANADLKTLEQQARQAGRGLWGNSPAAERWGG
jgi:micrococcal nuclease